MAHSGIVTVDWLDAQIERAREVEQVYVLSRELRAESWTEQAEQMLEQIQSDRVYLECVLEEKWAIQR